ncbi:MAG TPA: protein-methionine-sulfoxide reductase catalytic subunit MsrP [Planctomycetaceae bacterium]|nr:protein-methionine-sulfoxide reductase catalytic subunit MsrP [Planctomycetaceae bacterium]
MNFLVRRPWDLSQNRHTPQDIYQNRKQHRRDFLKTLGIAGAGLCTAGISGCGKPTAEELDAAGKVEEIPVAATGIFPAKRNTEFDYGRPETEKFEAALYTNFYEFSTSKDSWKYVSKFKPNPWEIEVGGLCNQPTKFDLDDLYQKFPHEERAYRFRCVEAWAMCVPWTGFPLRELLKAVEPKSSATHVEFETFERPAEAPGFNDFPDFPWPYREGLTLEEASNELTFLATGIYGEALPKQHGAPVRLVTPWKYGFKSCKSIVKITLTDKAPATFWNTYNPREYGFEANVDPDVPHPRWSQRQERMLGTGERYETVKFNGYESYVAALYA